MGDKTAIEWADATWGPTTGCDRVSPGCDHCYALSMSKRLKAMGSPKYQTDGDPATSGPGFGFAMHEAALDQPIRWKRPRKIFVNSMSDLFHGSMDVNFLAKIWAVMSVTPRHTYQILTKRPQIMRSVLTGNVQPYPGASMPFKMLVSAARLEMGYPVLPDSVGEDGTYAWPLRNVWLGTSVEDQKRADLRMSHLAATPAVVRFVSAEPLLGPVDLTPWLPRQPVNGFMDSISYALQQGGRCDMQPTEVGSRHVVAECRQCTNGKRISWVIVGGESGPGARPMNTEWVRSLRTQCVDSGVAFLFKQHGNWVPVDRREAKDGDVWVLGEGGMTPVPWRPDTEGAEAHRWGEHRDTLARNVGKKEAGRTLDGRTWDQYPVVTEDWAIETVTLDA